LVIFDAVCPLSEGGAAGLAVAMLGRVLFPRACEARAGALGIEHPALILF